MVGADFHLSRFTEREKYLFNTSGYKGLPAKILCEMLMIICGDVPTAKFIFKGVYEDLLPFYEEGIENVFPTILEYVSKESLESAYLQLIISQKHKIIDEYYEDR